VQHVGRNSGAYCAVVVMAVDCAALIRRYGLLTTGAGDARRLWALDTNLLQCPNSPGTEELPR
jgi:hypothetical protein